MIGPRLSDADFFEKIDTSRPGLEGIPAAVAAGDFQKARQLFAAEARQSLRPDKFLQNKRQFRGYHFMKPGESAEQAAARILEGELVSCATPFKFEGEVDWFSNPTFNQYKEWTWQLSRHPEWGILAERYRATGDERYAEAFVRYFRSWVRQALVPENADGSATKCWRTIETGIRMGGVWQWALHTFYRSPSFTDDVLIDWYKSVWEHGWRLRNFHRTGNWLIMEMNGLAQVSILYPQFKDSPAWKAYAFEKLTEELAAQIYPDGWQVELSTGYHQVDIHNYQWLIDVCKAMGEPVPAAFKSTMEKMHAVNVLMMMPDGRLPDLNDGYWHKVSTLMVDAAPDYPDRKEFLWALTEGKEGQAPAETSHAFDYAGYYISRSGWGSNDFWALLDGGHFGYGHQHEDKLSLMLAAYGRLLLSEGGDYAYDDSEMRKYVLSTRAHNTIRVDGQDQNRRKNYAREIFDVGQPSDGRLRIGPDVDVAEGSYDEGYGPQAEKWLRHERKVLAFKKGYQGLGPCLVVIDRLYPAGNTPHAIEMLWHFNTNSAVVRDGAALSEDAGLPNLVVIPALEAGLRLRVVTGQESPWQGWKSIKNHQQGEYAPMQTLLAEGQVAAETRLVTVVYPVPAGVSCPVKSVRAGRGGQDKDVEIALADGRVVRFMENEF